MWCFWPLFFLIFLFDDGNRGRRCRRRRRDHFFDDPFDPRTIAEREEFPPMKRYPSKYTHRDHDDHHCD